MEDTNMATHLRVAGSLRRLVIVADNSLIVEAIRIGFRNSGEFNLVGYADAHRTSAERILGAEPDVILLDDLDRFLEKRGHRFCRYADDCNMYVRSKRAAERVKGAMSGVLTSELSLRVNEAKSAVASVTKRPRPGMGSPSHPSTVRKAQTKT